MPKLQQGNGCRPGWVQGRGAAGSLAEIRQINRGAMNQNKYKPTAKSEALCPTLYERFRYSSEIDCARCRPALGTEQPYRLAQEQALKSRLNLFCQIPPLFFRGRSAVGWQCRAVR